MGFPEEFGIEILESNADLGDVDGKFKSFCQISVSCNSYFLDILRLSRHSSVGGRSYAITIFPRADEPTTMQVWRYGPAWLTQPVELDQSLFQVLDPGPDFFRLSRHFTTF